MCFLLGVLVIFYFMRRNFRKQQKEDLQMQVNLEFSQYYALSEKEKA